MLDLLEIKSEKDKLFCEEYYNWLIKGNTTDLRKLFKQINVDYWASLNNGSAMDTLDSVMVNFKI